MKPVLNIPVRDMLEATCNRIASPGGRYVPAAAGNGKAGAHEPEVGEGSQNAHARGLVDQPRDGRTQGAAHRHDGRQRGPRSNHNGPGGTHGARDGHPDITPGISARKEREGDIEDPCEEAPARAGSVEKGRHGMSESHAEIRKNERRNQRVAAQFEGLEGRITGYVLSRLVTGLKGVPGHPKGQGRPSLEQIAGAVDTPVHALRHPRIRGHIDRLAALHGIETPDDKAERLALARIAQAYGTAPVPVRGCMQNPHLSAIRLATGIPVLRLKTPACQTRLRDLIARNGGFRPEVDYDTELDCLAAYGDALRAAGERLPSQHGRSGPSVTRIARAIGISRDRFARPHLKTALASLARTIGVEVHPTMAEDVERFSAFVDARIALSAPVPMRHAAIGYRAIARMSGILAQRIANNAVMQRDLKRWLAAVNRENG